MQQHEQSNLSDTDGGRAVGIRKASDEQFRLQLTPERRQLLLHISITASNL